jgi:hypothetical protein
VEKAFKLRALMLVDPRAAKGRIVEAISRAGGRLPAAAKLLGIGHRTLCRWVVELGLEQRVERERTRSGGRMPRDGACSVRGCKRAVWSRGLCSSHYGMAWRREAAGERA